MDEFCSDGLYCNGEEYCDAEGNSLLSASAAHPSTEAQQTAPPFPTSAANRSAVRNSTSARYTYTYVWACPHCCKAYHVPGESALNLHAGLPCRLTSARGSAAALARSSTCARLSAAPAAARLVAARSAATSAATSQVIMSARAYAATTRCVCSNIQCSLLGRVW